MNAKIIFSPTGGTRKAADAITKAWGAVDVIDLTDKNTDLKQYSFSEDDLVLIAMPSYGGLAPQPALNRLAAVSGNGAKCVIAAVYGNRAYEDTLVQMEDAATKCGFRVIAAISAVAEHSIIRQYAAGRPDLDDRDQLSEFGKRILNKESDDKPAIPGNRPYKKGGGAGMVPKVSAKCVKCGQCAEKCPVGAIDPAAFSADKNKCISCMRCIKICPQGARKVNGALTAAASLALKAACSVRKENELFL